MALTDANPAFMPSIVEKQLETTMAHRSRASEFLALVARHADLRKKNAALRAAIFELRLECLSTRSRNSDALEALSVEIRAVFRRSRA